MVDTEKFHISAHGQLSCQDCHTDIIDHPLHPDPVHVSKQLTDFFDPEQCMECHDNVPEELENNLHGGKATSPGQSYENCLDCHNPHQIISAGDGTENVDFQKPLDQQCGVCHEQQTKLPVFSEEDETCLTCHRLMGAGDPDVAEKISQQCLHCHANTGTESQKITGKTVPLVTPERYRETPHSGLACTECHLQAAAFQHGSQETVDCGQCHLPHDEAITHDAHTTVACQTCHLHDVEPVRDTDSDRILWKRERHLSEPLNIHEMIIPEGETACRRCHTRGNSVGASVMVLPSKSVICMPCHTATLSFGDTITTVTLIVFCMGLGLSILLMISVSSGRKGAAGLPEKTIGSRTPDSIKPRLLNLVGFTKEIILNVFLQKRLFVHSPGRWFIHGLLFFPMALRFLWGIVVLTGSVWRPHWPWVWQLIDKNSGAGAFFFDITGVMIFTGVILALFRHLFRHSKQMPGLPRRSCLALVLLGSIVVTGFVLEGMRISMTGATGSAAFAFVGFSISMLFLHSETLSEVYGYGWYVHAALTGAFIAFLPFSRLLHIILSPMVFALNAITRHERK
ncbi:MAG: cytochrome c3 family protein [Desulfobacterales bacterium]|nr:cytochrome c3 family protein [Desulfobacterales bacterium]